LKFSLSTNTAMARDCPALSAAEATGAGPAGGAGDLAHPAARSSRVAAVNEARDVRMVLSLKTFWVLS
jgi:hypothetical protein